MREKLQAYLNTSACLSIPGTILSSVVSVETIDSYVENLIQGIQEAISHAMPFHNITPKSRPGFTRECKEAQQNAKRLKRCWRKLQTAEAWEAFRETYNQKSNVIKKAMRDQYRKETDEACKNPAQIWKRCK